MSELSSWGLVDAAKAGDRDAYGQLWRRYYDVVYAFVMIRLRHQQDAQDVTAETFARGLRRIDSVAYHGSDPAAWFVTIARNILLDRAKSSRYRLEVPCSEFTDAGHMPGVESEIERWDLARTMAGYVDQLRADQAEVIRLRFHAGLGVSEAAAAMGRSVGALKALQHRAVQRLAQLVDPVLV